MIRNSIKICKDPDMFKLVKDNLKRIRFIYDNYSDIFLNLKLDSFAITQQEEQLIKDFGLFPVYFRFNPSLFCNMEKGVGFFVLVKGPKYLRTY